MTDGITAREFIASDGTEEWRVLGEGACSFFATTDFAASVRFVAAIGELGLAADHPPEVDIRHDGVTVRLITIADDWFGMGKRDVELARAISELARSLGLSGDPTQVQSFLVVPGAPAGAEIMPFWRAVLGYDARADSPDEDLVDRHRIGPSFWFEGMAEPRGDGGGAIHVAVWVPIEQAEARVAAALAAGGRLVRNEYAPSWWTLADAAGNEADIATIAHRD